MPDGTGEQVLPGAVTAIRRKRGEIGVCGSRYQVHSTASMPMQAALASR